MFFFILYVNNYPGTESLVEPHPDVKSKISPTIE